MALPLLCHGFLDDLRLEPFFGIHFLELLIFCLKFLEPSNHRTVHTTILGTPFVKGGSAHAVLSAQFRHRCASLSLFQNRHDLAVRISGFTHRISFIENSTSKYYQFLGGLPRRRKPILWLPNGGLIAWLQPKTSCNASSCSNIDTFIVLIQVEKNHNPVLLML